MKARGNYGGKVKYRYTTVNDADHVNSTTIVHSQARRDTAGRSVPSNWSAVTELPYGAKQGTRYGYNDYTICEMRTTFKERDADTHKLVNTPRKGLWA